MPLGELAALGTAACWAFTSLFFATAARRIGPLRLNLLRLPVAWVLLSLALLVTGDRLGGLAGRNAGYLAASGVVGLVAGDLALFGAFDRLGPRLSSLLMSTAPIFATLTALLLLGELPGRLGLVGIALTLAGVAWVTGEGRSAGVGTGRLGSGIVLGLAGAACQGLGLVLAKIGMGDEVAPLPATWVRIGVATAVIWALAQVRGGQAETLGLSSAARRAWAYVLGGAFFGPFAGVWLSLVAARNTEVGTAATIMATTPILIIPLVMLTEGYRPSTRAVLGTVLAVAGVALLFLG